MRQAATVAMVVLLGIWMCRAADPAVTNVRAAQRPGTGLVDITYDLADEDTATLFVSLSVSTNGGSAFFTPVGGLSGDVGSVAHGTGKAILWNAGAGLSPKLYHNVKAQVTASDVAPPQVEGQYLVVDLSGGPSASSYPVTPLEAVPSGGWTDEHKTTKLVMRRIPAGIFTMGSPLGELGRANEAQHQVTLSKDFYVGVFEVTQKQWERVMGTAPSLFPGDKRPVERVSYHNVRENPANSAISPNWPASSQVHADSFMGKLRTKTGLATFDLPTEAQWEYACRAGTTRAYNDHTKNGGAGSDCLTTGSGIDSNLDPLATYWANSANGNHRDAGSKQANAWGLYDMHGNVWEWCLDWYEEGYSGAATDPAGAEAGTDRAVRGGSWFAFATNCRSAYRFFSYPGSQFPSIGFRAALHLP